MKKHIDIGRPQRAGQPRQMASPQREAAQLRRRSAHLWKLLGPPEPQEEA